VKFCRLHGVTSQKIALTTVCENLRSNSSPVHTTIRELGITWITRTRRLAVIQNHQNPNVRAIGEGEAIHRKYKRLKLGNGQAYHRSSD
jgi:hypothetical protein